MCGAVENSVKECAIEYLGRGLAVVLCDGKRPIGKDWQLQEYSTETIEAELSDNPSLNVGVILGPRSGIVDIEGDDPDSEAEFLELFDGYDPVTWKFQSTRGVHRLFKYDSRLESIGTAVTKWKTVEIRGCNSKASQTVFPPSVSGGIARVWLVAPEDCELATIPDVVISKLVRPTPNETVSGDKSRPGDEFNANGPDWSDILTSYGWTKAGDDGQHTSYWRRPGKSYGTSATTGHLRTESGSELLYVFSTNAPPLEAGKAYTKFAALATLEYGGDFSAAAASLADQGYGEVTKQCSKVSAATQVIDMLLNDSTVELFHTPDGEAFATVPVDGHFETYRITTQRFKSYIAHRFYNEKRKAASAKIISDALAVLSGKATYECAELNVALRIAGNSDDIYIDRGSSDWDAVKISADGFQVVSNPPVKFWRSKGMLALPAPEAGGSLEDLRSLLTLGENQFALLIGVLLSYLSPDGPYPITVITGEQGTAKSTTADLLRRLIDPKEVQRQAEPKNVEALMVAARNNWIVSYDNLSGLPQWLSDGLCRLSTGGGLSSRELFTNGEEFVINAKRPAILNSIVDVATKPDLLDRSVVLELEPIAQDKRRDEVEFWHDFANKQPRILGVLYEAVSCALQRLPSINLTSKPRMADFAKWVTAAEPSLGFADEQFLTIYQGNMKEAGTALLDSVVAQAVTRLVDKVIAWEGTPTELYTVLTSSLDEASRQAQGQWPGSAAKLSGELRRIAPVLRTVGYQYESHRTAGQRQITLSKA